MWATFTDCLVAAVSNRQADTTTINFACDVMRRRTAVDAPNTSFE